MLKNKFMVAVAAIIENPKGEILLIKRSSQQTDYPSCWEDVGGRLKQSESPEQGLLREIKEETGLIDVEIIKPLTIFHIFRKNIRMSENELIGISYWCKTREDKIILSEEHSDFLWIAPYEALKIVGHPALREYILLYLEEEEKMEKYLKNTKEVIS